MSEARLRKERARRRAMSAYIANAEPLHSGALTFSRTARTLPAVTQLSTPPTNAAHTAVCA